MTIQKVLKAKIKKSIENKKLYIYMFCKVTETNCRKSEIKTEKIIQNERIFFAMFQCVQFNEKIGTDL